MTTTYPSDTQVPVNVFIVVSTIVFLSLMAASIEILPHSDGSPFIKVTETAETMIY